MSSSPRAAPGHPVQAEPPFGERRELTALCYDLVDSTSLLVQSDLEDFQNLVSSFQAEVGQAIRKHGGSVRDSLGDDGGIAFFGYPTPMEDGATAAIRAGLDLIDRCSRLSMGHRELQVRVGIATSEVVVQESRNGPGPSIVGYAPTIAARLQNLASANEVVVSERTRTLAGRSFAFQPLGFHRLKGLKEEHPVWAVRRRAAGTTRFFALSRVSARLVGRQPELDRVLEAWRRASAGIGQALVVQGEAGIGKSRFALEALKATRGGRSRLLMLQCSPTSVDSALSPLADLLRSDLQKRGGDRDLTSSRVAALLAHHGIADTEAMETIAFAIGATGGASPAAGELNTDRNRERLVAAVMHCIDTWTATGPLVIAVEDVHWIDPTSRLVLRSVAALIRSRPVLLLMTSRDDLHWGDAERRVGKLRLKRLRIAEATDLVKEFWSQLEHPTLPAQAVSLLFKRTNGIPLFMEEVLQWLQSDIEGSVDRIASLARAPVTRFETLLSARLGALGPAKRIAQIAAVLGVEFEEAVLHSILPTFGADALADSLRELFRAGILTPRKGYRRAWTFRHSLIQETIYKSLVRSDRTAVHRQIFEAAVLARDGRLSLGPAILGTHAEGAELHIEAAANFVIAAKEGFARSAVAEALSLLRRAQAITDKVADRQDRERTTLAVAAALGPILISSEGNKSAEACKLYEQAVDIARTRPIEEQAALFPIYWGWWYTGADFAIQLQRAETVTATLAEVDDPEVQLQARHCVWAIEFNLGHHANCLHAVESGLALYDAGQGRHSLTLFGGHDARVCGLGQSGLSKWFQGQPSRAVALVGSAVDWAQDIAHVGSLAHAYDIAAMLHRYREDLEALKTVTAAMRRLARVNELPSLAAKALIFDGWRLAKLGDPGRGRVSADAGFAIQWDIGTREDFPVYSDMRAEILALCAEPQAAMEILEAAIDEARRTGHFYWVPELYRRRASLLAATGGDGAVIQTSLETAMQVALDHGASTLFLRACETAMRLGIWPKVGRDLVEAVEPTLALVEGEGELGSIAASIRLYQASRSARPISSPSR